MRRTLSLSLRSRIATIQSMSSASTRFRRISPSPPQAQEAPNPGVGTGVFEDSEPFAETKPAVPLGSDDGRSAEPRRSWRRPRAACRTSSAASCVPTAGSWRRRTTLTPSGARSDIPLRRRSAGPIARRAGIETSARWSCPASTESPRWSSMRRGRDVGLLAGRHRASRLTSSGMAPRLNVAELCAETRPVRQPQSRGADSRNEGPASVHGLHRGLRPLPPRRVVASPRIGYFLATATFSITAATSDYYWLFIPALMTCRAGIAAPNELKRDSSNGHDHAPAQSTPNFINGATKHPGLTLLLETLELAATARHPGGRILARYPARILAHGEQPLHAGGERLRSARLAFIGRTTLLRVLESQAA